MISGDLGEGASRIIFGHLGRCWTQVALPDGRVAPHLVLPYTLCTNDSKFAPGRAFSTAHDFLSFCSAAVDQLLSEAEATGQARMLSVGLHPRLIGHPASIQGLLALLLGTF